MRLKINLDKNIFIVFLVCLFVADNFKCQDDLNSISNEILQETFLNDTDSQKFESTSSSNDIITDDDNKQKNLNEKVIDITQYLNKAFELIVKPSTNNGIYEINRIRNADSNFQIEMRIESTENDTDNNNNNPIRFSECAISTNERTEVLQQQDLKVGTCLETYIQVHKSDFRLIVRRWLLARSIKIKLRVVISGCFMSANLNSSVTGPIRDIHFDPEKVIMPRIVHYSDHECIYRVKNTKTSKYMIASLVEEYPEDLECLTYAKLASTSDSNDYSGQLHTIYDSFNSTQSFPAGVLIAKDYLIIKTMTCRKNRVPITFSLNSRSRAYKLIDFSSNTDSAVLFNSSTSLETTSSAKSEDLLIEILNENSRDLIEIDIKKYLIKNPDDCSDQFTTSIINLFAVNDFNQVKFKQFDCINSKQLESIKFKGYKRIHVQFYRTDSNLFKTTANESTTTNYDEFLAEIKHTKIKSFTDNLTEPGLYISSQKINQGLLVNSQFDYQIQAPPNYRIILEIVEFSNGQPIFDSDCLKELGKAGGDLESCFKQCEDESYMIVKSDFISAELSPEFTTFQQKQYTTTNFKNQKICNFKEERGLRKVYTSHSNVLQVSLLFSSRLKPAEDQIENSPPVITPSEPAFNFTFKFEPLCNNNYKSLSKESLNFDSSTSFVNFDTNQSCANKITASQVRKIVVYKTNWFGNNIMTATALNGDGEDVSFLDNAYGTVRNGELICREYDSFSLSNFSPKYNREQHIEANYDDDSLPSSIYCNKNPFESFLSKSNVVFLNFRKATVGSLNSSSSDNDLDESGWHRSISSSNKLILEIGYFTYKYLFTNTDSKMVVNFAYIIPKNVDPNVTIDLIDFRIKAADSYYIVPTIKDCRSKLSNGQIKILANERLRDFNRDCNGQAYLLFGGNSIQQLEIRFENVNLHELRERKIGFTIEYESKLKILKELNGSFSSIDFKDRQPFYKMDDITYEWIIDVEPKYYIRLTIEKLENIESIENLAFYDLLPSKSSSNNNNNKQQELLYDLSTINQFYQLKNRSYILTTNKLLVKFAFNHRKAIASGVALPFVNLTYTCESRSIELTDLNPTAEIKFASGIQNDYLVWIINAPKNHQIQVKILDYLNRTQTAQPIPSGQLMFSQLSQRYSYDGNYFFDLQQSIRNENYLKSISRPTDLVISKENVMHIKYTPRGLADFFTLAFSLVKIVQTNPFGIITQYFNEKIEPIVFVPKLTEQTWIIKAPLGKKIQLEKLFIDLVDEDPCSKAQILVIEKNGTQLANLCGNFDEKSSKISKLTSYSNELTIKFITQQTDEVVYDSDTSENQKPRLYRGFKLAYNFKEEIGDCYFIQSQCSYQEFFYSSSTANTAAPSKPVWLISGGGNSNQQSLKAVIAPDSKAITSLIVSPILSREKRYLKFQYNFDGPKSTKAAATGEDDYEFKIWIFKNFELQNNSKSIDDSVIEKSLLVSISLNKTITTTTNDEVSASAADSSKVVSFSLGKYVFTDYRVAFVLIKKNASKAFSKPITASISYIQALEFNTDCGDMDGEINSSSDQQQQTICLNNNDGKISTCERYVSPCSANKCSQKGTAICINEIKNQQQGYFCQCKTGFTGLMCETKIDPCADLELNKCENNSTCLSINLKESDDPNVFLNYTCNCQLGYRGTLCEKRVSPCKKKSNMCNHVSKQGECIDLATQTEPEKFECLCAPEFSGKNCEIQLSSLNPCSSESKCRSEDKNARCVPTKEGAVCICSVGFEGENCKRKDKCSIYNPCKHNATCTTDNRNELKCLCKSGYSGRFCEKPIICAECNQNGTWYCDYGFSSSENINSPATLIKPKCICHQTHFGEKCDKLRDLCSPSPKNGVGGKGQCKNGYCTSRGDRLINQTKCVCDEGFSGQFCDKKETQCDLGICMNGASCNVNDAATSASSSSSFDCSCREGFTGKFCEKKVDKCQLLKNPCQNGGKCINNMLEKNGTAAKVDYFCECPISHTGKDCEIPMNFCAMNKCPYDSLCQNLDNDYVCRCPANKFGRHCELLKNNCVNNNCMHGHCVELNEHLWQPEIFIINITNNTSSNSDSKIPYRCECLPGFTGQFCDTEINECESNPCLNNGKCIDLLNGYTCECPQNVTGKNCENLIHYCSAQSTSCVHENYVSCKNFDGHYKCNCAPGFVGPRCERRLDICELKRPCFNGKCVANPANLTDYKCVDCPSGYTGQDCEILIDTCSTLEPCKNGAKCYSIPNDFYCECPEEFTGKTCDVHVIKACIYNRCKNNATCVSGRSGAGYECVCDSSHHGRFCEKDVTLCDKIDCQNGICDPKTGKCVCNPLFPSSYCEANSLCEKMTCLNGGTCVNVVVDLVKTAEAKCICPPGLTGRHCELSVYCDSKLYGNICGENSIKCKTNGKDGFECDCKEPFTGPYCNISKTNQAQLSVSVLKQMKESNAKYQCGFGISKQSKIFIAILTTCLLLFGLVGFLIAHCAIKSYKNKLGKLERAKSSMSGFSSLINSNTFDTNNNNNLIPQSSTKSTLVSAWTASKSPESVRSFTIPRPTIYPTPRTQ